MVQNLFYWPKTSHLEHLKLNTKGPNLIQNEPTTFSPTKLKLKTKSLFSQQTFSQFWSSGVEIWVQGNLPCLPQNLSQFPLLADCGSKFRTRILFLHFLVFQLWHFDFSLVKVPLAFCSLYIWNFWLDSPQIITSKESKGKFGLIMHFWPL